MEHGENAHRIHFPSDANRRSPAGGGGPEPRSLKSKKSIRVASTARRVRYTCMDTRVCARVCIGWEGSLRTEEDREPVPKTIETSFLVAQIGAARFGSVWLRAARCVSEKTGLLVTPPSRGAARPREHWRAEERRISVSKHNGRNNVRERRCLGERALPLRSFLLRAADALVLADGRCASDFTCE